MKNRIVLVTGLLILCIVGQILLRSSFGDDTDRNGSFITIEQENAAGLAETNSPIKADQNSPKTDSLREQLFKQLLTMIAFVGVIGIGAWFFCKKFACTWTSGKGKNINVIETVSLGPRKLMHIVSVGSKQFLLGSTPENIRLLAEITESLNESNE
jgi:flagellar biogenesis protein FliO